MKAPVRPLRTQLSPQRPGRAGAGDDSPHCVYHARRARQLGHHERNQQPKRGLKRLVQRLEAIRGGNVNLWIKNI